MRLFPNIRFFKNDKGKYKIVDYLKRNNVEGEIIYNSAKKMDSKIDIPIEVGQELEDNLNFTKNVIYLYKTKTEREKALITDAFNRGIPVEDSTNFAIKNGCKSLWKLFENLASLENDEIALLVKVLYKDANDIFDLIDGETRVMPQYVYGALMVQNGSLCLVKNGTPQISEIIANQTR